MARKLKVYAAEIDGLHEWIVAAPNQGEALAAFGISQDLFAQGLAKVTSDAVAVEAAMASPGSPLRRAQGSRGKFVAVDAAGDEAGWSRAAKAAGVKAANVKPGRKTPKPPDRRPLDAAEAALASFESDAQRAIGDLDREQIALDARRGRLERDQAKRREALNAALVEAKRRFEAGG